MERLTTRECGELLIKYKDEEYRNFCFGCESINECYTEKVACCFYKALEKLAEYEDLEEQGKLLKLLVPVGSLVYEPYKFMGDGGYEIDVHKIRLEDLDKIGRTVFLTREEAESSLKKVSEVTSCEENATPACAGHA